MTPHRVEDPRDRLEKATRDELVAFAHSRGQVDISERLPATDIRKMLRDRGMTDINIHERPLGAFIPKELYGLVGEGNVPEVKTTVKETPAAPTEDIDAMSMTDLRKQCKARGIRMARTDKLEDLRAKLRGQAAS